MDDAKMCPMCGLKMRTVNLKNKYLHSVGKQTDYIERACTKGINHTIMLFTDKSTGNVDFVKVSLNAKYSKFLEIDFVNGRCRIACIKNGKTDYISINKILNLDFPTLDNIKKQIDLYVTFS